MPHFREDFQKLSRMRRRDALSLLRDGRFSASYYYSGFSVECAVKACIAKATLEFEFPDKKRVEQAWKHGIAELVVAAGLKAQLKADRSANGSLDSHWRVIEKWDNEKRYDRKVGEAEARDIYRAIASRSGVLAWFEGTGRSRDCSWSASDRCPRG